MRKNACAMTSLIQHIIDTVAQDLGLLDAMTEAEVKKLMPLERRNWGLSVGEMKASILSACASHLKDENFPVALAMLEKAITFSSDEELVKKLVSFLKHANKLDEAIARYSDLAATNEVLALQLIMYLRQSKRFDEALNWCGTVFARINPYNPDDPDKAQYRLAELRHQMKVIFFDMGELGLCLYCHLDQWWRQRVGNALGGRLLPIDDQDISLWLSDRQIRKALSQLGVFAQEPVIKSMIVAIEPHYRQMMRLSEIALPRESIEDPENPGVSCNSNQPNVINPEYMNLFMELASPQVVRGIFNQVFGSVIETPLQLEAHALC
jgi:hypothetical protein